MKKALLILSLIYFISCKTLCSSDEEVKEAKDCFGREPDYESTSCCYVDGTITIDELTQSGGDCYSFKPGISKEELAKIMVEQIKTFMPDSVVNVTINSYKCSGSFLKIGFLFLALFLF